MINSYIPPKILHWLACRSLRNRFLRTMTTTTDAYATTVALVTESSGAKNLDHQGLPIAIPRGNIPQKKKRQPRTRCSKDIYHPFAC